MSLVKGYGLRDLENILHRWKCLSNRNKNLSKPFGGNWHLHTSLFEQQLLQLQFSKWHKGGYVCLNLPNQRKFPCNQDIWGTWHCFRWLSAKLRVGFYGKHLLMIKLHNFLCNWWETGALQRFLQLATTNSLLSFPADYFLWRFLMILSHAPPFYFHIDILGRT